MSATITDPRFMHLVEKALEHERKQTVHKMPTSIPEQHKTKDQLVREAYEAWRAQQMAQLGSSPIGTSIYGPPQTHNPASHPSTHIVPDDSALIPKHAPEVEARVPDYVQNIADLQTQVDQLTALFNTLAPMIAAPLNADTKKGEAA